MRIVSLYVQVMLLKKKSIWCMYQAEENIIS